MPDAIITGTGLGCLEDTEKFLTAMVTNKEEFLTPTSFIQSTHNTVSAQIALLLPTGILGLLKKASLLQKPKAAKSE